MALRDRQIGGRKLPKDTGFFLHGISSVIVFVLSYFFWLPKFFGVPEELCFWIALLSSLFFFLSLFAMVKEGYAGALLWNGTYTDDSYSGLYCTPKPPFPIILLLLKIFASGIYDKIFWSMGTIVSVQDVTVPATSQVLSSDGFRFRTETSIVLTLESVARFLIQTSNGTNMSSLFEAVTALYSSSIKSSSLSSYTAQEIFTGKYQKDQEAFTALLMDQFDFVKNYGFILYKVPIVKVVIESQKMEKVFDQVAASSVLDKSADFMSERLAAFMKKNPGIDEAVALAFLRGSSGDEGGPNIDIVRLKS